LTPVNQLNADWLDLLAADPDTLAPAADGNLIALIQNDFTSTPNTILADLTLADFTGATPLEAGTGTQQTFIDPTTSTRILQVLEPAGGWHWQATNTTNLPQTIYGYALTSNDGLTLFATERFTTPVTLTGVGDAIDIDQARFAMSQSALS